MNTIEQALVIAAVLLVISVFSSKASGRLGVPLLVLFVVIGVLAGSESIGGIYFADAWIAQSVGVVALVLILFAGGMDTVWSQVRPVLKEALALSTLGVAITALVVAVFAVYVLGFRWLEGLLLGAIVSSTDAAAVFSILRDKAIRLKYRLEPMLELESGSNDPMAVFLTLSFTQLLVNPNAAPLDFVWLLLLQGALGLAFGYGIGRAAVYVINRLNLRYDGLYLVFTIAVALLSYGVTASLMGSGFLAVYITGIVMGNSEFVHRRSLINFHDGVAWLMQIVMFLTLGLLVFPSQLVPVAGLALLTALVLMLVARPVAVAITLLFSGRTWREKALVSWVGLRGAVPIILATFPLLAGVPKANLIFNLVFFVVLTSVLIQGTSIPFVARLLRLNVTEDSPPARFTSEATFTSLRNALTEMEVPSQSPAIGKLILELHLPEQALVILLGRNGEKIIPSGRTEIRAGDHLLVLGNAEDIATVLTILGITT